MKIATFLIIFLASCNTTKDLIDMEEKIKIELDFKQCIDPDNLNEVVFIIQNLSTESLTIHAWHLYLIELYTNTGKKLNPHTIIEYVVPDSLDEYVTIEAQSTKMISFSTEFFQTFSLDKNTEYYVEGEYNGTYSSKGERFKIRIAKTKVKTC